MNGEDYSVVTHIAASSTNLCSILVDIKQTCMYLWSSVLFSKAMLPIPSMPPTLPTHAGQKC